MGTGDQQASVQGDGTSNFLNEEGGLYSGSSFHTISFSFPQTVLLLRHEITWMSPEGSLKLLEPGVAEGGGMNPKPAVQV